MTCRGGVQGGSVTVFHDVKMARPVTGGNLPSGTSACKSISVDGDTAYFVLNLGYSSHLWGMKATVSASVDREVVSMPWIVDLLRGTALAAAHLCRDVVRGNKLHTSWRLTAASPPTGMVGAKWLSSDLLSGGLAVAISDASVPRDNDDATLLSVAKTFLLSLGREQASESVNTTFGVSAIDVDCLLSSVVRILPVLPNVDGISVVAEAESTVSTCVARVFAVLLHHNHLGTTLASFASLIERSVGDSAVEAPLEIVKCWKAANRCA